MLRLEGLAHSARRGVLRKIRVDTNKKVVTVDHINMVDPINRRRFEALPQREKKHARTKVSLLHALVDRLEGRTLEDVSVRELCDAVQISEASFFNYFPKKSDVLVYFVELWSIEAGAHADHALKERGALEAIEAVFALTASAVKQHPSVMAEVIAHQARMSEPPGLVEVSLAERLFAFPELLGADKIEPRGLDAILPRLLDEAVRRGELPRGIDKNMAFLALGAMFFGVPLLLRRTAPEYVGPAFKAQLSLIWAGLTAEVPPRPSHRPAPPKRKQRS